MKKLKQVPPPSAFTEVPKENAHYEFAQPLTPDTEAAQRASAREHDRRIPSELQRHDAESLAIHMLDLSVEIGRLKLRVGQLEWWKADVKSREKPTQKFRSVKKAKPRKKRRR